MVLIQQLHQSFQFSPGQQTPEAAHAFGSYFHVEYSADARAADWKLFLATPGGIFDMYVSAPVQPVAMRQSGSTNGRKSHNYVDAKNAAAAHQQNFK